MDKICAALPRKWHVLAYNFSSFRLHSSKLGQKYLAWISIRKIRTNWWIELTRAMWISDGFATTVHISKVHFHIACTHTQSEGWPWWKLFIIISIFCRCICQLCTPLTRYTNTHHRHHHYHIQLHHNFHSKNIILQGLAP